jgi:hypothetical protein
MTLDEAQARIVARMTPDERAVFENGCKIVDWLMDVATDSSLPQATRDDARRKLRACAHRKPHEAVHHVIGSRH